MSAHRFKLSLTQSMVPTLRKIKCQAKHSQALQVSQSGYCPVRDMARWCGGTSQKVLPNSPVLLCTSLPQIFLCYRWHFSTSPHDASCSSHHLPMSTAFPTAPRATAARDGSCGGEGKRRGTRAGWSISFCREAGDHCAARSATAWLWLRRWTISPWRTIAEEPYQTHEKG